jgi:hypothetical protein
MHFTPLAGLRAKNKNFHRIDSKKYIDDLLLDIFTFMRENLSFGNFDFYWFSKSMLG